MIKNIGIWKLCNIPILFTIFLILNLSGCTYFSDNVRQQNLSHDLACHYQFQQRPGTTVSPAQYYLCGNKCYPCTPYTPWTATMNPSISTSNIHYHPVNPSTLKRTPV